MMWQWQPIETAPTDGTYIMLGYTAQGDEMPRGLMVGVGAIFGDKLWIINAEDNEKMWPSYWMHLPMPPK